MKNVWITGAGSAMPVVSITIPSCGHRRLGFSGSERSSDICVDGGLMKGTCVTNNLSFVSHPRVINASTATAAVSRIDAVAPIV